MCNVRSYLISEKLHINLVSLVKTVFKFSLTRLAVAIPLEKKKRTQYLQMVNYGWD